MVYCSGSSGSRQKRSWNGLQKILGLTCFVDATRLYARSAKRTITGVAWRKRQFFAFAFYFNITRSSELSPLAHPAFETAWDCLHFSFIFTICQCFSYQYFPVCTPTIDFGQTHTLSLSRSNTHTYRTKSNSFSSSSVQHREEVCSSSNLHSLHTQFWSALCVVKRFSGHRAAIFGAAPIRFDCQQRYTKMVLFCLSPRGGYSLFVHAYGHRDDRRRGAHEDDGMRGWPSPWRHPTPFKWQSKRDFDVA